MKVKHPAVILALVLFAVTISIVAYRILWLKYPVLPAIPGEVWQVSFEAHIRPEKREVAIAVALPAEQSERILVEERFVSDTLSFNLLPQGINRIGLWAGASDKDVVTISYRGTLFLRPKRFPASQNPSLSSKAPAITHKEEALLERFSARLKTLDPQQRFAAVVSVAGNRQEQRSMSREDIDLLNKLEEKNGKAGALLLLFRAAGLPAHTVSGLLLARGIQTSPTTWVEAWEGKKWQSLDPETGKVYMDPSILLALATAGIPVIETTKGQMLYSRWNLEKQTMSKWRLHFERLQRSQHLIDRWSFFSIPEEFQNLFRILFLVPVGALMICLLRNVIGFPTFGIFMPVLLALAFRSTGLAYGLGIFASVILIGYAARRGLDRLRLLLVPRLSVLLTLVIICFGLFALIGGKLSIRALMGVGLLPIVILAMSIERFFILIEESGVREALRTAAGTVAVAVITFIVIQWEPLQLTFFIYPELLFAVGGIQILLGRYTGYRVSELLRFKAVARKKR